MVGIFRRRFVATAEEAGSCGLVGVPRAAAPFAHFTPNCNSLHPGHPCYYRCALLCWSSMFLTPSTALFIHSHSSSPITHLNSGTAPSSHSLSFNTLCIPSTCPLIPFSAAFPPCSPRPLFSSPTHFFSLISTLHCLPHLHSSHSYPSHTFHLFSSFPFCYLQLFSLLPLVLFINSHSFSPISAFTLSISSTLYSFSPLSYLALALQFPFLLPSTILTTSSVLFISSLPLPAHPCRPFPLSSNPFHPHT